MERELTSIRVGKMSNIKVSRRENMDRLVVVILARDIVRKTPFQ